MKTFVKIFLLVVALMVIASAVFAAPEKVNPDTITVSVTPTQYKDLLVLKADKQYFGAIVEVHDSTGALITSSELHKRKMIIDFYDIPYGIYTISIVKNNYKKEFKHIKTQDSAILN